MNYSATSVLEKKLSRFLKFRLPTDERLTIDDLGDMYMTDIPISSLVLYDEEGAAIASDSMIDVVVVSFSHGTPTDVPDEESASIFDVTSAIRKVRAANSYSYIVGDLPSSFYPIDHRVIDGARALIEAGADAVKIEGSHEIAPFIRTLSGMNISVVGHIGFMPKTKMPLRYRGADPLELRQLQNDARSLQQSGAVGLVLELVTQDAAEKITSDISIPTFGVYSGRHTSGQVLVLNDILDITHFDLKNFPKGKPRSIGTWTGSPRERVSDFSKSVKLGTFPA